MSVLRSAYPDLVFLLALAAWTLAGLSAGSNPTPPDHAAGRTLASTALSCSVASVSANPPSCGAKSPDGFNLHE